MGVIAAPEEKKREAPELPIELADIYYHFKRLRFGRNVGEDVVTLVERRPLQYAEIESYCRLQNWPAMPNEINLIMDMDAIFECRDLGGKNG